MVFLLPVSLATAPMAIRMSVIQRCYSHGPRKMAWDAFMGHSIHELYKVVSPSM